MNVDSIFPRIIAPDVHGESVGPPSPTSPPARRSFDYVALVRRAYQRAQAGKQSPTHLAPPEWVIAAKTDGEASFTAAPTPPAREQPSLASHESLARADTLTVPFVSALASREARLAGLLHFLATRIADFCSDQSILSNGHWSARLRLADHILPDCMLHLDLSHFELRLRFEARDPSVSQLIFQHTTSLERQIATMLVTLGNPRDVSIHA